MKNGVIRIYLEWIKIDLLGDIKQIRKSNEQLCQEQMIVLFSFFVVSMNKTRFESERIFGSNQVDHKIFYSCWCITSHLIHDLVFEFICENVSETRT